MVTNIMGKSFRGNMIIKDGLARKIFGIGPKTAEEICAKLGFYPQMRVHQLDEPKLLSLTKELSLRHIETDLRNEVLANIKRKHDIGSYQGLRHAAGLPVRGQSTKNNARMAKKLNRVERRI